MKKINTDVLIIGAGPVGLFTVFELGQLGMKSCVVDSLEEIGGQCTALYPDKPIYDIPAYPSVSAEELIINLKKQIDPFNPILLMSQKVKELKKFNNSYIVKTSEENIIEAKCIVIAAGNGAFGPNKPPLEKIDSFENKTIFYHVNDKTKFKNKSLAIAGGGDSAVDWAIELSKISKKIFFIHRRKKLRAVPQNVEKLYDLEKKGVIKRNYGYNGKRAIAINKMALQYISATNTPSIQSIPVYNSVAAGFPSPAEDHTDVSLDLNQHLIQHQWH